MKSLYFILIILSLIPCVVFAQVAEGSEGGGGDDFGKGGTKESKLKS